VRAVRRDCCSIAAKRAQALGRLGSNEPVGYQAWSAPQCGQVTVVETLALNR
jgi:hypothetical protein